MKTDRAPCDEHCPLVVSFCCGLPEYYEIQLGLQSNPPKVWACHSNDAIPCVATGLNSFPQGSERYTESEKFIESLDKEYGLCSVLN